MTNDTEPTDPPATQLEVSPLVSVLIPVWNSEKFLDETLHAVCAQTYRNLEVLLVDDGSTDSTPSIERDWAARDPRIRIIRQQPSGVSVARNRALEEASGEDALFVDSDDVPHPGLVATCLKAMRPGMLDIAMYKFDTISEDGRPLRSHYAHNSYSGTQTLTPRQAIREQLAGKIGGYAWSFLAPLDLYRTGGHGGDGPITFPAGRSIEDLSRICQILGGADRIVRLDQALYSYRLRKGSLMGSGAPGLAKDWTKAISEREDYVHAHFPQLMPYLIGQKIGFLGNLDYESLRQSIVFGLGLDADTVSKRQSARQSKRLRARQTRLRRKEEREDKGRGRKKGPAEGREDS